MHKDIHTHTYIYTYTHTLTHIHTHTHTHMNAGKKDQGKREEGWSFNSQIA